MLEFTIYPIESHIFLKITAKTLDWDNQNFKRSKEK